MLSVIETFGNITFKHIQWKSLTLHWLGTPLHESLERSDDSSWHVRRMSCHGFCWFLWMYYDRFIVWFLRVRKQNENTVFCRRFQRKNLRLSEPFHNWLTFVTDLNQKEKKNQTINILLQESSFGRKMSREKNVQQVTHNLRWLFVTWHSEPHRSA